MRPSAARSAALMGLGRAQRSEHGRPRCAVSRGSTQTIETAWKCRLPAIRWPVPTRLG